MSHQPRRRWRRAVLVGVALLSLSASSVNLTHADELSDKRHQNDQLNATMAQLKKDLANAKNQESVVQNAITALDAQVTGVEQQISAAQNQLDSIENALAVAQDQLVQVQLKLEQNKQTLAEDIVLAYKASAQNGVLS